MNIKKIGLTALAGSLVATSAFAVDYSVSGNATAKWSSADAAHQPEASNGKGVGLDTDVTLSASGELDNGFTVSAVQVWDTDSAVSNTSSQLSVGMGSFGTLALNNRFGGKANGIDDVTPNAYNETWDGLSDTNPSFFGDSIQKGVITYKAPTFEVAGVSINAAIDYDTAADEDAASSGGRTASSNSGTGLVLELAHDSGLSIGAGQVKVGNGTPAAGGTDEEQVTAYAKYSMGPVSVGYQEAYQNTENGGQDKSAAFWSVAYTAGDLSVSYAESSLTTEARGSTVEVEAELESLQASYSMGAMTISAATAETSNANGVAGQSYEENEIAVSFAF